MDWKKFFTHMVTVAKIISFISLCLSVYIKVKTLIGTTKKTDDEEKETETETGTDEPMGKNEAKSDEN